MQINMDINKLNAGNLSDKRLTQVRDELKDRKADEKAQAGTMSEEVRLSDRARSLQAAAEGPVFDEARVESIRAAIAEGRYHVHPERLAERFLALENQLG